MNRQYRSNISLALCVLLLASGCQPTQPFFFQEDGKLLGPGDLSHYMDIATDIEYPDVHEPSLDEVNLSHAPLTIANSENFEIQDFSLEEVTRITLTNSMVIRQLGGRISDNGSNIAQATPETLQNNPGGAVTTYDPALVETGNGTGTGSQLSGTGVESALAEFDAVWDASTTWNNNNRPQNFGGVAAGIFAGDLKQDQGNFTTGITKTTANGSQFEIRNNITYDANNNTSRASFTDFFVNYEVAATQPLLQGAGTQINRIAGPQTFQQAAGGVINQIDGVIISRIRHDITLADFEAGVRNLMRDVEDAYWELYFAYRDLEARKVGRESALETWRKVKALQRVGGTGGEADKEAQARAQYFLFRSQVETALTNLFRVENRLRYMMGLAASDGRLIRPIDEPTTAPVNFDWPSIHSEALARRNELRRQKWQVKRRELELIASRNNLLPRMDLFGRYRWLGAGNELLNSNATGIGPNPFTEGANAFESLVSGRYQEAEAGIQFSMPIGFRRALSGVRHHQLLLARERAVLQDLELEISHQLSDAVRDIDHNFGLTQTNFNRRVAEVDAVDSVEAIYDSGRVTLDLLLDTQRRRAEAESAYYRSLVDYNRAIMRVHLRKGSLLEYNGVYLAEGPWPGKAQFDALRRARQRDASTYLDYGFTRPNVISRGPHGQITEQYMPQAIEPTPAYQGPVIEESMPLENAPADNAPTNNENPAQEVIPVPTDVQATSAMIEQASFGADYNTPVTMMALPAVSGEEPVVVPTVAPAVAMSAATGPASPTAVPALAQPQTQESNVTTLQPELHTNPYRQDMKTWMDSTTGGLPNGPTSGNPLRSVQQHNFTTTWAADSPTADEPQTHHSPVEVAPDTPVWPGAER